MKSAGTPTDKKTYLLLPDLLKEAKLKQRNQTQPDKENNPHASNAAVAERNEKILLSHYLQINSLKNTAKLREDISVDASSQEESFKSELVFNESEFLNREAQELRQSCSSKLNNSNGDNEFRKKKPSVDLRKQSSKENSLLKSSEKKRRNSSYLNKVLKDIKSSKQPKEQKEKQQKEKEYRKETPVNEEQAPLELPLRTLQQAEPKLAVSVEVRDQLQPVVSLVEQMVSSQSIFFDPDRFEHFLKSIRHNREFQRALKAFIYSYYMQNHLKQ